MIPTSVPDRVSPDALGLHRHRPAPVAGRFRVPDDHLAPSLAGWPPSCHHARHVGRASGTSTNRSTSASRPDRRPDHRVHPGDRGTRRSRVRRPRRLAGSSGHALDSRRAGCPTRASPPRTRATICSLSSASGSCRLIVAFGAFFMASNNGQRAQRALRLVVDLDVPDGAHSRLLVERQAVRGRARSSSWSGR